MQKRPGGNVKKSKHPTNYENAKDRPLKAQTAPSVGLALPCGKWQRSNPASAQATISVSASSHRHEHQQAPAETLSPS